MGNETEITLRLRDLMTGQLEQVDGRIKRLGGSIETLGDSWRKASRTGMDAFLRSYTEMVSKVAILDRMGSAISTAFSTAQSARDQAVQRAGAAQAAGGALALDQAQQRLDLVRRGYSGGRLAGLQSSIHRLRQDYGETAGFDGALDKSLADGRATGGNLQRRLEQALFGRALTEARRREMIQSNGAARAARAQMEGGQWAAQNGSGGAAGAGDLAKAIGASVGVGGVGLAGFMTLRIARARREANGATASVGTVGSAVGAAKVVPEWVGREAVSMYTGVKPYQESTGWATYASKAWGTVGNGLSKAWGAVGSGFRAARSTALGLGRVLGPAAILTEGAAFAKDISDRKERQAWRAAEDVLEARAQEALGGGGATGPGGSAGHVRRMAEETGKTFDQMITELQSIRRNTAAPVGGL